MRLRRDFPLLAALALAACARRPPTVADARPPAPRAVPTGTPAPELPPLEVLAGAPVRLAELRGRVVLLHFWTFG